MQTFENHVQALADYLPSGRLFEAKNIHDSNFRQLLRGLSGELFDAQGFIQTLNDEYLPDLTNLFLDEWEQALGMPDDCFPGTGTNDERRRAIIVKLASLGVQTANDFVALAALFGTTITVEPLVESAFLPYTVPFTPLNVQKSRYTIVVTGENLVNNVPPYDVPFDLTDDESIIKCLLVKQAPENCNILFVNSTS